MPSILMVTTSAVTLHAFLTPYADHLRSAGWTVEALAADLPLRPSLAEHFDRLHAISWSRSPLAPSNLAAAPRVRRLVADRGYDVVHVHTPVASFVTRLALSWARSPPVVYTAHGFHFFEGNDEHRNLVFQGLERMAGRWTDRLVVINREDHRAATRLRIVPPERLVYMPGIGLDFEAFDPARVDARRVSEHRSRMGLGDDDVLFSMVAEFIPRKRHRDAILALARVKSARIHLAFAGDGPLRDELRQLAHELALSNRVHFLGFVDDPAALMLASRATLLPSAQEGLARVLMESACLGVPMIGSDARGVVDVIGAARGEVHPVGDLDALSDAMLRMAREPASRVTPDPAWRIEHLVTQHEAMYGELLAERG